jgi:hypothetical protein
MTDYTDIIAFVITLIVVIVGCILNNTIKDAPLLPVYREAVPTPLSDIAVDADGDRVI